MKKTYHKGQNRKKKIVSFFLWLLLFPSSAGMKLIIKEDGHIWSDTPFFLGQVIILFFTLEILQRACRDSFYRGSVVNRRREREWRSVLFVIISENVFLYPHQFKMRESQKKKRKGRKKRRPCRVCLLAAGQKNSPSERRIQSQRKIIESR